MPSPEELEAYEEWKRRFGTGTVPPSAESITAAAGELISAPAAAPSLEGYERWKEEHPIPAAVIPKGGPFTPARDLSAPFTFFTDPLLRRLGATPEELAMSHVGAQFGTMPELPAGALGPIFGPLGKVVRRLRRGPVTRPIAPVASPPGQIPPSELAAPVTEPVVPPSRLIEPTTGELGLGGRVAAQEPVPLIDAQQVAERQRLAAEAEAGQQALPEAVGAEGVKPPPSPPSDTLPPASLPSPRVPPEEDPVIQKALKVLKQAKRVSQQEQASLFATERRARFARGMEASEDLPLQQGFKQFFGAQAGEFPRPDIVPIVDQFSEDEISHLFSRLEAPGVLRPGYDQNNAAAALADLLNPSTAKIPMPRDLALLERAFGSNFARELYNLKRTASQRVWDEFIAAWNLPRSLMASLDLSATLRQGAILAPGNLPEWRASVAAELKAFGSESYAAKAWDDIYLHPNYERLVNAGLSLTERGAIAPLLKREEAFMSRWAGLIPGVRASERAYVTMLNKLRFDVADKMLGQLERQGLSETELQRQLGGVTDFVNWTTGRGPTIPGGRTGAALQTILNGAMFSPRFMTSRFATLTLPVTAYENPAIRTKLATDLVAWVSVVSMVTGLAKAAGARVETDPRSGEFGKIVLGDTRYDPWAGMQPMGRLIAQLIWGQSKTSLGKVYSADDEDLISKRQRLKSEGMGKISDEEFAKSGRFLPARFNLMVKFLRSKLQPLTGEGLDLATGKDWLGGQVEPAQALSKDPRVNLFAKNLVPILAQDILDAITAQENPLAVGAAAGASALGIGTSTYQNVADIAREKYPRATLKQLQNAPPETQKRWREEMKRRQGLGIKKLQPTSSFDNEGLQRYEEWKRQQQVSVGSGR